MVGTEDYISPEVLEEKVSGPAADLWSLGVIIYMMLTGNSPFKTQSQFFTFRNIKEVKYSFPDDDTFTEEAKDLVSKLLVRETKKRLGAGEPGSGNGFDTLKAHPFFDGIDFSKIFLMQVPFDFAKY
jgi:serine/threonine protein kinase